MPEHVYKVVEVVGSSEVSVSKAIDRAIAKASETLRNIGWFEVEQMRGHIENGTADGNADPRRAGGRAPAERRIGQVLYREIAVRRIGARNETAQGRIVRVVERDHVQCRRNEPRTFSAMRAI